MPFTTHQKWAIGISAFVGVWMTAHGLWISITTVDCLLHLGDPDEGRCACPIPMLVFLIVAGTLHIIAAVGVAVSIAGHVGGLAWAEGVDDATGMATFSAWASGWVFVLVWGFNCHAECWKSVMDAADGYGSASTLMAGFVGLVVGFMAFHPGSREEARRAIREHRELEQRRNGDEESVPLVSASASALETQE
jgi:hypothetical protein